MQNGHLVVIGQMGTGKRSFAHLSAIISEFLLFNVQVAKRYNHSDYLDDIRKIFIDIVKTDNCYLYYLSYKYV